MRRGDAGEVDCGDQRRGDDGVGVGDRGGFRCGFPELGGGGGCGGGAGLGAPEWLVEDHLAWE